MTADWHEKHILLKVTVPSSAHNEKATFEIPYGSIERRQRAIHQRKKAKFEVPALHWADLSDATHGVSLLNDCKYATTREETFCGFLFCARPNGLTRTPTKAAMNSVIRSIRMAETGAMR